MLDKKKSEFINEEEKLFTAVESIQEEIENKNLAFIENYLLYAHPADIAEAVEVLKEEDFLFLFRHCEEEKQRKIFVELSDEKQSVLVENLSLNELSIIIGQLESDEKTHFFSDLDKDKAEEILGTISREESRKIRLQLEYEEGTAGRMLNLDFAVIRTSDSMRKAIHSLRQTAKGMDIYIIYVVDELGMLKGCVRLKDILLASPKMKVYKLMKPVRPIHVNTHQEEVAKHFRKYDLVTAPIVDDEGRMIGRITVDDVLDIVQEEATKDIYGLAGVGEEETIKTSVWGSVKHRLLWLSTNLVIAMFTASIVSLFEDTIQKIVILASLMPIVAGMGGNAGTQAITIVVRSLATGELTNYNWFSAVRKEFTIGIINGLTIGLITFIATYFIRFDIRISVVIGLAMLINLSIAGLIGSLVPLVLKFFKVDPAVASSIFVTACTDMFGFFCFLGLATKILT